MNSLNQTTGLIVAISFLISLSPFTAQGAALVINPANSSASITFDDTGVENSDTSAFGTTNVTLQNTAWDGSALLLSMTIDPVTGDSASSGLTAWTGLSIPSLWRLVELMPTELAQPLTSIGVSTLTITYSVEFEVNHLSSRGSFMPFRVRGNVLDPDSFVAMNGEITFTSASMGWLETLTFDYFNNTPGVFDHNYAPQPTTGGIPNLGGDLLTVTGNLVISVDPAEVTITQIPEPGSALLLSLGGLALVALVRKRKR